MFGLTRREQRWKADQQAAELLVGLATAAINAQAQVAIAETQSDRDKELAALRAEVAENAKLIVALAECRAVFPIPAHGSELDNWYVGAIADPLAVPAYVKACVEALKDSREFYERRVNLLQFWQSKMRDPERTIVFDIIANGQTLPPKNAGDRYSIPAEASPVEPSQAQPSDTAITYMTGYSDAKDWAATLPGAQTCSP